MKPGAPRLQEGVVKPASRAARRLHGMDMTALPALDPPAPGVTPAVGSALLDVLHEARERWGEVVGLPVDLAASGWASSGLPAALAGVLAGLLRQGRQRIWLGPRERGEPAVRWLQTTLGARLAPAPMGADVAALRAAGAEPALWGALQRGVLVVEVPQLAPSAPLRRSEPGDADLTVRLVVHYPGEPQPRRLAVGGLSRQFWRERAAAQRGECFDIDLLLTHRTACCHLPAAALISVQA